MKLEIEEYKGRNKAFFFYYLFVIICNYFTFLLVTPICYVIYFLIYLQVFNYAITIITITITTITIITTIIITTTSYAMTIKLLKY